LVDAVIGHFAGGVVYILHVYILHPRCPKARHLGHPSISENPEMGNPDLFMRTCATRPHDNN
jgi:hypothetical protein